MLKKRCSVEAMSENVRQERRRGRPAAQAAAIGYRTLKEACGCRSERRMTPKQIVACGKKRRRRRRS